MGQAQPAGHARGQLVRSSRGRRPSTPPTGAASGSTAPLTARDRPGLSRPAGSKRALTAWCRSATPGAGRAASRCRRPRPPAPARRQCTTRPRPRPATPRPPSARRPDAGAPGAERQPPARAPIRRAVRLRGERGPEHGPAPGRRHRRGSPPGRPRCRSPSQRIAERPVQPGGQRRRDRRSATRPLRASRERGWQRSTTSARSAEGAERTDEQPAQVEAGHVLDDRGPGLDQLGRRR